MIYDIRSVEKAKELLKEIEGQEPNFLDYDFILEHITTNMDECKNIKEKGIKSIKRLIEEDDDFIKRCKKNSKKNEREIEQCIEQYKKYNNKICTFFSYENAKKYDYKDCHLERRPEAFERRNFYVIDNEWEEKAKAHKITIKVKGKDIRFPVENQDDIDGINQMLYKNIEKQARGERIAPNIAEFIDKIDKTHIKDTDEI